MVSSTYLLTSAEVAARLGISQRQVSRLVARGELTPVRQLPDARGRGPFLFSEADITADRRER